MLRLKDIFDLNSGALISNDQLKIFDPNFHFLNYRGLKNAIPTIWKRSIVNQCPIEENLVQNKFIEKFKLAEKPTRFIYNILLSRIKKTPEHSESKWDNRGWFDRNIVWSNIYLIPHQCTEDTSLISFQYKILTRTIFTNDRLFAANLHGTILCSFCNTYFESIDHLFYFCNETRNLYFRLSDWIEMIHNLVYLQRFDSL